MTYALILELSNGSMNYFATVLVLGIIFGCDRDKRFGSSCKSHTAQDTVYVYHKNLHTWDR